MIRTLSIRFSLLVFACLTMSACETMADFYDKVIVASFDETFVEPVKNAELSYCAGCDWIVQEYHDEWSTRNSKPYDTKTECDEARYIQRDRNPDTAFRCIHESDLH